MSTQHVRTGCAESRVDRLRCRSGSWVWVCFDGGVSVVGRRPRLDRDRIVRTALAVIDRDGVAGLTMRKFGAELGVDPMAVYYYLPDKGALFDAVVEAVHDEIGELTAEPGAGWQSLVWDGCHRMRTVLRRHPHTVPLLGTRPVLTPRMLAFSDRLIGQLVDTGLTAAAALNVLACARAFTIGYLLIEVGVPAGPPIDAAEDAAEVMADYPSLATAMAQGYDPDRQFDLGLRALVDGLAASLSAGSSLGSSQ
jgi:TetR/AcrR family tetracycline transcriptional repressor